MPKSYAILVKLINPLISVLYCSFPGRNPFKLVYDSPLTSLFCPRHPGSPPEL